MANTLSRPPGAAHTAGSDSSSDTAGLDSCSQTAGPDSSSHTAGPDSCPHTAGPDSSPRTAGPDSWYEERAAGLNSLASTVAVAVIPPASSAQVDLADMVAAQPRCHETMLLQRRTTSLNIVPQRIAGVLLLQHLTGAAQAGGARLPQAAGFRRHSRGGAPWGKGYSPPDSPPFRLEGHGGGCGRLDQGLPAVPEG